MNGRSPVVALACACCAACSLFLDTGEFSGENGTAVGTGDAATPATDAEPKSDAATPNDGAGSDGGADAGPPPCPDGGFCDSFERTTVVGAWGGVTNDGNGCTLAIDGTLGSSGASSLKEFVAPMAVDSCQAFVTREFPDASPTKIVVSFDFRVDSIIQREVQIVGFGVLNPERRLFFSVLQGSLYIAEQQFGTGGGYVATAVGGLEADTWHHVELAHDIGTQNLTVKYDGDPRVTKKTVFPYGGSGFSLYVGNAYSRGGDAAIIWFDDFRFQPTF